MSATTRVRGALLATGCALSMLLVLSHLASANATFDLGAAYGSYGSAAGIQPIFGSVGSGEGAYFYEANEQGNMFYAPGYGGLAESGWMTTASNAGTGCGTIPGATKYIQYEAAGSTTTYCALGGGGTFGVENDFESWFDTGLGYYIYASPTGGAGGMLLGPLALHYDVGYGTVGGEVFNGVASDPHLSGVSAEFGSTYQWVLYTGGNRQNPYNQGCSTQYPGRSNFYWNAWPCSVHGFTLAHTAH